MVATEADGRSQVDVLPAGGMGWDPQKTYSFELNADKVRALLTPPNRAETEANIETKVSTKTWVENEARRMKADAQIPADTNVTGFAKALAKRMEKAARSNSKIRAVGWGHLRNKLAEWGLWPISII
jgi:hypothetical protein